MKLRVIGLLLAGLGAGGGCSALTLIDGRVVQSAGQPLVGAVVSVQAEGGPARDSTYSDAHGRFQLRTRQLGKARLRVRAPAHADLQLPLALAETAAETRIDVGGLSLVPLTSPRAVSDALSASAHAARVQIADAKIANAYRSQCFFCHQIGNAWTRRPRSEEEWRLAIDRMQRYGAVLTWSGEREIRRALAQAFDGHPIADRQDHVRDPEIASAQLREVNIGDANSFVHDLELGRDGRFHSVDMGNDLIHITDFVSGRTEAVALPPNGLPLGGAFSGMSAPIATTQARHGPHSIVLGPDGRYYMTNSLAAEIGIFDPRERSFRFVPVGRGAAYPHTLRFDAQGVLWFTIAMSNQLGRYDPRDDSMQVIALPSGGVAQWLADQFTSAILRVASWFPGKDLHLALSHHKTSGQGHLILNLPYGLDINPRDGSVWYSKLYADRIGRYDPKTGAIQEWPTPRPGPRRLRFGPDGTLWIPAFGGSALMRFDTKTQAFTVESLPVLAEGEFETPYALAVHPASGDVWITSNLSDRLFRYSPATRRWLAYPMSTSTTYMRDIVFRPDGAVCSVNANLPAAAIEGQAQQIVCLAPDGHADWLKP